MGRRHTVNELDEKEFDWIIERIINGDTDRQVSIGFEEQFGRKLAKSSLHRWRKAAGEQLAERYRLARYQARQLLQDLKKDDTQGFEVIMQNLEDHLLSATREVITADPVKLLNIRLEEERRRQKDREIDLQREKIELEREKLRGAAVDKAALAEEFLSDVLEYIAGDAEGLKWFKKHAKRIAEFVTTKYAEA